MTRGGTVTGSVHGHLQWIDCLACAPSIGLTHTASVALPAREKENAVYPPFCVIDNTSQGDDPIDTMHLDWA